MINRKHYDVQDAVAQLEKLGIAANLESYGFSASLVDETGLHNVQCGFESDGDFSLCFQVHDGNNQWFVGSDIRDIVKLISTAHEQIRNKQKITYEDALNSISLKNVVKVHLPSS